MKQKRNKLTAIVISIVLLAGTLPISAFAEVSADSSKENLFPGTISVTEINAPIISIGAQNELFINMQSAAVTGSVYSNGDISFHGNTMDASETLYAGKAVNGNGIRAKEILENQEVFGIHYLGLGIKNRISDSLSYEEDKTINNSLYTMPKSIVAENSLAFKTSAVYLKDILMAKGDISFQSSIVDTAVWETAILFSQHGNISIDASSVTFSGLVYAPNGKVEINSSYINFNGMIIAEEIIFNGSQLILKSDSSIAELINSIEKESISLYYEDDDNDGLENILEEMYGTDYQNPDTDGDGLPDGYEVYSTGTDPIKTDTDGNGILDCDEDPDEDGLTNLYEYEYGTDPLLADTDFDGLNDYDEVFIYGTNPLNPDTDGDGLTDGIEIEVGTDSLVVDTDGNGISDYDETYTVTRTTSEADTDDRAIPTLAIHMEGSQIDSFQAQRVTDDNLFPEDIPGFIGSPYDFSVDGEIESAVLTFQYDTNMITEEEFHPAIYWFDEENQMLMELPDQSVDLDNGTVTAELAHFSTYILLNKIPFDEIWEKEIKSPTDTNLPLDIALSIDSTGSMSTNDRQGLRKEAAKNFVEKLGEDDRAAIIAFMGRGYVRTGLTSNKSLLNAAINTIDNSGGSTSNYYGLEKALEQFQVSPREANKSVIILTDGLDNTGPTNYMPLINEAKENDITIFAIGLGNSINTGLLTGIAESTGGKYYHATDAGELADIFDEAAGETIDLSTDTDNDGICDYLEKMIANGTLRTGTGASFKDLDYTNPDSDGDGLLDGEELVVTTITMPDGKVRVYIKMLSNPCEKDSDGDGYTDKDEVLKGTDPLKWDVGDRDLAIFAALAYEDGKNYIGKMYSASDVKGKGEGQFYYFNSGADLSKTDIGISTKWKIVNFETHWADIDTYFSATTFKNGNDVVIAYRGTDGEIGEWINNILGVGVLNYHSEESYAKAYALKTANEYKGCNIYITGHSLGGYLSQIGAAKLLENSFNIKGVIYFNGIGLKYNQLLFWSKSKETKLLENYNKGGGRLISYYIYGDVVSALGNHSGQEIGFYAVKDARETHAGEHGKGFWTDILSKSATGWLCVITGKNLAQYYEYYQTQSIKEFFWITHETDSFYYYLSQGRRRANS